MPADRIVLMPGLSYGPSLFAHQTAHLAEVAECHVVEVDDPDVDALIDATLSGVDGEFALVAHSGATLGAIALAAAAPERVSHLVLQGAMGRPLPPIAGFLTGLVGDLEAGRLEASRDAVRGPALGGGHPDQDEIERRVLASQAEVSRERFVAQCRFIVENMDQTARLAAVRAPTLFVHARDDGYFDLDLTSGLAAEVHGSRLVVVEDSGHLMAIEQPQALTALIGLWCETGTRRLSPTEVPAGAR